MSLPDKQKILHSLPQLGLSSHEFADVLGETLRILGHAELREPLRQVSPIANAAPVAY